MGFQQALDQHFPGTVTEEQFVSGTLAAMQKLGFTADNTIACVGVCRDEVCRSLVVRALDAWGEAFNFSSLAGMLFLGKTGFSAAHHHAPTENGRERYVYFAMAHIGIGPNGEIGWCERLGRTDESYACGALWGFKGELEAGVVNAARDQDDIEQSILKSRMLKKLEWGEKPDFVRLTKVAYEVIREDLERMIDLTVDRSLADYGVLTGIQIHAEGRKQYIWPGELYTVVQGEKRSLSL
jgi:hypothetical protein